MKLTRPDCVQPPRRVGRGELNRTESGLRSADPAYLGRARRNRFAAIAGRNISAVRSSGPPQGAAFISKTFSHASRSKMRTLTHSIEPSGTNCAHSTRSIRSMRFRITPRSGYQIPATIEFITNVRTWPLVPFRKIAAGHAAQPLLLPIAAKGRLAKTREEALRSTFF